MSISLISWNISLSKTLNISPLLFTTNVFIYYELFNTLKSKFIIMFKGGLPTS